MLSSTVQCHALRSHCNLSAFPRSSSTAVAPSLIPHYFSQNLRADERSRTNCSASNAACGTSAARPSQCAHSRSNPAQQPEPASIRGSRLSCSASARESTAAQQDQSEKQKQNRQKLRKNRAAGRESYRPASFRAVIADATTAILSGLDDGLTRLEVELPSVGVDSASSSTFCPRIAAIGTRFVDSMIHLSAIGS